MATIDTPQEQAEQLAIDILELSRNTLLIKLRFLDSALCQLPFDRDYQTTFATDGFCFYYNFIHVLKSYKIQKELVMRDYLHTVFHCIFHHPFIGSLVDSFAWDLACDIAVEAALNELNLPELNCMRCSRQSEILAELKNFVPMLTAEKLYHHFHESGMPSEEMETLRSYFIADDHHLWYQLTTHSSESDSTDAKKSEETPSETQDAKDFSENSSADEKQNSELNTRTSSSTGPEDNNESPNTSSHGKDEQEKLWHEISSRIQTDLETLSRQYGDKTGILLQNILECTREKTDYREFLQKFAVLGEETHINDDEFDYIYYTYGLELYDDIPLVEPLEYKEVKKIREFVIAIDTSASVKGELVQSFLQKTFEILIQEDTFFEQVHLHIIQCDTSIQDVSVIQCKEHLQAYLHKLENSSEYFLHGFGGTDFRPVFSYIHDKQEHGELLDLHGLLYFTDGDGIYPETPTDYHTAFLFTEKASASISVPTWAMKIQLDEDSLRKDLS